MDPRAAVGTPVWPAGPTPWYIVPASPSPDCSSSTKSDGASAAASDEDDDGSSAGARVASTSSGLDGLRASRRLLLPPAASAVRVTVEVTMLNSPGIFPETNLVTTPC